MWQWLRSILTRFYILEQPVVKREKKDRRADERRWEGPEGDRPRAVKDPRRRRERRKKSRRV